MAFNGTEVQDLKARVAELEEAYEASKSEAEFYLGKVGQAEFGLPFTLWPHWC